MGKRPSFQERKAHHKTIVRKWLLGQMELPTGRVRPDFLASITNGNVKYYLTDQDNTVSILKRECLVSQIALASSEFAGRYDLSMEMTEAQASDCLYTCESYLQDGEHNCNIAERIDPVGFSDDEHPCFTRLPISRAEIEHDGMLDLGSFMDSLRTNMADYDGDSLMFRRLLSAIGALLWDSVPRREILYWHGHGGEGKTTLCNFLAHKLGPCALPSVNPKELTDNYTKAMLEGVRLVIAEEAGKGRFLTDEIKAITGNRFITARAPYEAGRTFQNHTFIWITSNHMPIIDGESASKDRLRLVCSTPRKDGTKRSEADIYEELEQRWPNIVKASVREYLDAGGQVWPMLDSELEEPVDSYHMDADGWIRANLEHMPGAFVPTAQIKHMLRRERIGLREIESRMHLLNPSIMAVDGPRVAKVKKRVFKDTNPVWGWKNVSVASISPSFADKNWTLTFQDE